MDKLEYFILKNSNIVEDLIKLEEKNAIFESSSKDFNNWKALVYKALINEDIKIADNSKNVIYESMFANGYKAESLNESSRTWAEKKYDELMEKGKDQWDEDDWDAYHYIMQVWGEMGYFDESLNESEESDIRVIRTGLSGAKNNEILNSIIGQMSDGIWENSPSIEPYWMFANVDDDCNFVVKSRPVIWDNYNRKGRRNPYYQKPDHDILRYFANKLKQIVREYANDKGLDFKQLWNRDSEEVCDYLGYDEDITIGDAFKVYQALR